MTAANGRQDYAAPAGRRPPKDSTMALNVAIQMDPIESVNIDADSTFVLALEAISPNRKRRRRS